ncbi:MAG: PhoH family protein [Spirochaetales bacterium]|nr:PhoH family protein [Spirochaetales bacterium]
MEELLGVKLYVRGNEISLDTDDANKYTLFKSMIEQLEDFIKMGQEPETDLIMAIHKALNSGDKDEPQLFKKQHISIPGAGKKIYPKSKNQAKYLDAIDTHEIIFSAGPAGTGKTFLAVAKALQAVFSRTHKRLVITRPVVEAGESLGYLPGDLAQKINPYLRPIYDSMWHLITQEGVKKLEDSGQLEIAPLAYMRGRTLAESIIILDEAQNTTREQMKMLLTRLGAGSKLIVTGDITQIDLPRKKESGMLHAIELMKHIHEICIMFFTEQDVVRHPLVRKIINAYESEE